MKRRLKGYSKYYPGQVYGFDMGGLIFALLMIFFFKFDTADIPMFIYVAVIIIACAAMVLAYAFFGKKLFDFTEDKYYERFNDYDTAHNWAVTTEVSTGVLIAVSCVVVVAIII